MLRLDITFSDGCHSHAWGGIDEIESAIERAATTNKPITGWSVTDLKEA